MIKFKGSRLSEIINSENRRNENENGDKALGIKLNHFQTFSTQDKTFKTFITQDRPRYSKFMINTQPSSPKDTKVKLDYLKPEKEEIETLVIRKREAFVHYC